MKNKDIIIKPIVTEKAAGLARSNKFVFEVSKTANKKIIAQEIKKNYKVDPVKINIINISGEKRMIQGRYPAYSRSVKKAIVLLKKGQKIEGFEE